MMVVVLFSVNLLCSALPLELIGTEILTVTAIEQFDLLELVDTAARG
jgi:hypothetical protein